MSLLNIVSLLGAVAFAFIAWLAGGAKRPVPWRTVIGASITMLIFCVLVFWMPPARYALLKVNDAVLALLRGSSEGALFLFGPLSLGPGQTTAGGEPSVGFILATQVLPAVVFFAALMALLFHLRLVQPVVRFFGRIFHRTLGLSGAEALSGSANIFFGVESATTIRPYIEKMTRSELLTVLTCGMSTVASTTLAIYVLFLSGSFPGIAGHLISASVISIPAAVLVSKLMLPESAIPETLGTVPEIDEGLRHGNSMSALAAGAWDGLKLAAGIATLLIAVLGIVGVLNSVLGFVSTPLAPSIGGAIDLNRILGWLFTPVAWLLGVEGSQVSAAGGILGSRAVLTEVVAYQQLAGAAAAGQMSERTLLILSYALCGFAHIASMGIFVGGISALAPSRRNDLAGLGFRALICATLATLITGALAGMFYHGQRGLLGF